MPGFVIMLRPIATFCMSLTESSAARRLEQVGDVQQLRHPLDLSIDRLGGLFADACRPKAMLSNAVICVKIA